MRTAFRALALAATLALPAGTAAPARKDYDREIAKQRSELDELKARVDRERKELVGLRQRKSGVLERMDKLAENIAHTREYLDRLRSTEEALNRGLAQTRSELAALEDRIRGRNQVMARRVRALFIAGKPERLFLLPEGGGGDFFARVYFVRRLVRYDHGLVVESRSDAELKRRAVADLRAKLGDLERFQRRKAQEMEVYSRGQKDQEREFARLQADETAKGQALAELEENARLLTEIIRGLEKKRQEELARNKKPSVLEARDKYCAPVEGEIVSAYGLQYHATLKTTTKNLGIEIEGGPGQDVRAAVSGEVALITQIPGYGLGVILDNGSGYFTIYANLGAVKVKTGDKVKTCQDIASLPGTAKPRVYFEVRQGTKTLDPAKWLK